MLATPGRFFEKFQKMDKVYRRFYQHELAEYQFTPNEIAVILFLYNNAPDLDTATDIVRCKGKMCIRDRTENYHQHAPVDYQHAGLRHDDGFGSQNPPHVLPDQRSGPRAGGRILA